MAGVAAADAGMTHVVECPRRVEELRLALNVATATAEQLQQQGYRCGKIVFGGWTWGCQLRISRPGTDEEGRIGYLSHSKLDLDHIVRLADGGTNAPANLQMLCRTCHDRKTEMERGGRNGMRPVTGAAAENARTATAAALTAAAAAVGAVIGADIAAAAGAAGGAGAMDAE